ncbi:phage replisome organizer, partial [mine drainage metagenome]
NRNRRILLFFGIPVGKPEEGPPPEATIPEKTPPLPNEPGRNLLIQAGVIPQRAEDLARKNEGERIRAVVEYAQSRRPANPPAFIVQALEEGWKISGGGAVPGHEPDPTKTDLYRRDLNTWKSLPYGQRSRLLRHGGWGNNGDYPSPFWLRETLSRIEPGEGGT